MNKRQKKKKGLLLIKKVYSNYGKKKNESIEKKVVDKIKVEEAPIEEIVEEVKEVKEKKVVAKVKVEEAPIEEIVEEVKEEKN